MSAVLTSNGTNPETTLAVILGGSEFKYAKEFPPEIAFSAAAEAVTGYLLGGLCLPINNMLNLFNIEYAANDLDLRIVNFVRDRQKQTTATDLIIYFVGHGAQDERRQFVLIMPTTRSDNIAISSLNPGMLATTLAFLSRSMRIFVIIDACFSGKSLIDFAEGRFPSLNDQLDIPERGVAFLCSSSARTPSRIRADRSQTVFSKALVQVLWEGSRKRSSSLTLIDLEEEIWERIQSNETEKRDRVRPKAVATSFEDSDLTKIPLFPNAADGDFQRERKNKEAAALLDVRRQELERLRIAEIQAIADLFVAREAAERQRSEAVRKTLAEEAERLKAPGEDAFRLEAETFHDRDLSPQLLDGWLVWKQEKEQLELEVLQQEARKYWQEAEKESDTWKSWHGHQHDLRRKGHLTRELAEHFKNERRRAIAGRNYNIVKLKQTMDLIEPQEVLLRKYEALRKSKNKINYLVQLRNKQKNGEHLSFEQFVSMLRLGKSWKGFLVLKKLWINLDFWKQTWDAPGQTWKKVVYPILIFIILFAASICLGLFYRYIRFLFGATS
jgi:Caspase domain